MVAYREVVLDERAGHTVLSGALSILLAIVLAAIAALQLAAAFDAPFCQWRVVGRDVCDVVYESQAGFAWFRLCRELAEFPGAAVFAVLGIVVAWSLAQPATVHVDERTRRVVARTRRWPFRARVVHVRVDDVHLIAAERVLGVLCRWVAFDEAGRRIVLGPLRLGAGRGAARLDARVQAMRGE